MDYLQYEKNAVLHQDREPKSFKPYYKWITFNTRSKDCFSATYYDDVGFKPYYKWITFNTDNVIKDGEEGEEF